MSIAANVKKRTVSKQSANGKLPGRKRELGGRPATGLYPEISRTLLAERTGRNIGTISYYFMGRAQMPFEDAMIIAPLIGVSVERLNEDLRKVRRAYLKSKTEN